MNKDDFFKVFKKALDIEIDISENTELEDIPEYDSLGRLILVFLLEDEFGVKVTSSELFTKKKVKDIWLLVSDE
jgi:acyl carrier protein